MLILQSLNSWESWMLELGVGLVSCYVALSFVDVLHTGTWLKQRFGLEMAGS
jgi:hypothetical protein